MLITFFVSPPSLSYYCRFFDTLYAMTYEICMKLPVLLFSFFFSLILINHKYWTDLHFGG